jgi:hypothetical protein
MGSILLIHIGKCAGGTVKMFLEANGLKVKEFHLIERQRQPTSQAMRNHNGKVLLVLRDPVSRIISAFNWRHPSTKPPKGQSCCPITFHSPAEKMFYKCFDHVNAFAEALDLNSDCGDRARKMLTEPGSSLSHIARGYQYFLGGLTKKQIASPNLAVISYHNLNDNLHAFMRANGHAIVVPASEVERLHTGTTATYPKKEDTYLSARGKELLVKKLHDIGEYQVFEKFAKRSLTPIATGFASLSAGEDEFIAGECCACACDI